MELYFTPRSHFSRKVRILLDAWQVPVTLIDVGNVASTSAQAFGPNPLMKVPVLVDDDGTTVLDSDHIARYLTRRRDPDDRFAVLTGDVPVLNARAIMNGIMAAEVEILLTRRMGGQADGPRLEKLADAIRRGLDWLEDRAPVFSGDPSYAGFHLVCLWDHLACYQVIDPRHRHRRLDQQVQVLSSLPYVAASAPPRL